jgi:hypothetical protein
MNVATDARDLRPPHLWKLQLNVDLLRYRGTRDDTLATHSYSWLASWMAKVRLSEKYSPAGGTRS